MVNHATGILSTPIRSAFIDDRLGAVAYYRYRLVWPSPHKVTVNGQEVIIRFVEKETHPYSTSRPCDRCSLAPCDVVKDHQVDRCFDRGRARRMDDILPTIANFSRATDAGAKNKILLVGPRHQGAARMAIVLINDAGSWIVRTTYPISDTVFQQKMRAPAKKWP